LEAPSALSVSLVLSHAVLPKDRWAGGPGTPQPQLAHGRTASNDSCG
jgi:hypothetical protein